jgi:hypothetical protein
MGLSYYAAVPQQVQEHSPIRRRQGDARPACAGLANPGVEEEIYVGEPVSTHRDLRSLGANADRLIRHHQVAAGWSVDQKVPSAITRKWVRRYPSWMSSRAERRVRRVLDQRQPSIDVLGAREHLTSLTKRTRARTESRRQPWQAPRCARRSRSGACGEGPPVARSRCSPGLSLSWPAGEGLR